MVPSSSSRVDYTGDDLTNAFPFTFPVTTSADHVEVLVDGVKQVSGFTVALHTDQASAPGGDVTFTSAPARDAKVRIQRTLPMTQETVYTPYSAFPAKTTEKALDRLTYQAQQIARDQSDAMERAQTAEASAAASAGDARASAALALASAQAVAQGAVGGNFTLVTASGSTMPRSLAERAADVASIRDFGGVADGATDALAALVAAAAAVGNAGVVRFPGRAGQVYYFSGFNAASFAGIQFDVDPGVVLSLPSDNNVWSDSQPLRFVRPTRFYWRSLQRYYTVAASQLIGGSDPAPTKDLWVDEVAADRSSYSPVICNNASEIIAREIGWNTDDSWDTVAVSASSASSFSLAAAGGYLISAGLRRVLPGDELMAQVSATAGAPLLVGIIRHTDGYTAVYGSAVDMATDLSVITKTTGVPGTSSQVYPAFRGTHASYAPHKAVWSIRIDSWKRAAILLNGWTIATVKTSGYIVEAGYGMLSTTGSDAVSVNNVVVARGKGPTIGRPIAVRVFGDSRAAPRYDAWPDHLKTALEFTGGARVWRIDDQAVAGQTSWQQAAALASVGVADVDVVVIDVGTNDVQVGTAVPDYVANITSMVDAAAAAGKAVVLVAFDLWYTQNQAGAGVGQASLAYDLGAPYRAALFRLAAERQVKIIDSPSLSGPILAHYVNAGLVPNYSTAGDPYLSDNIHPTTAANRLRAREVARAIVGALLPAKASLVLPDVPLAATAGWATTAQAPYASVDAAGVVHLDGLLNDPGGATRADGTVVLTLPEHLRPTRTRRFRVHASLSGETPFLNVDALTGQVTLYGLPSSSYFSLDSLSWPLDARPAP